MPYLTAAFFIGLVKVVLSTLGVGIVTFVGLNLVLGAAVSSMRNGFMGGDANLLGLLGLMQVDLMINVLVSAYTIRLVMTSLKIFRVV